MAQTLVYGSFLSFVKCQAFDMAFILWDRYEKIAF